MKFYLSFTLLWLGVSPLFSAQIKSDSPLKTQISAVVVYADGARVSRRTSPQAIPQGTHTFTLKGLPESFTQNSLQAQLNTPYAKVVSLSVTKNYLNLFSDSEYQLAKETLDKANFELDSIITRLTTLSETLNTLKALTPLPPTKEKAPYPITFDIRSWQEFIAFTQDKLRLGFAQFRIYEALRVKATQSLDVAQSNYNKVRSKRTPREESLLEVKIIATQPIETAIEISYMLRSALWRPCYDLRVNPETAELTLISYAVVQQHTGEEWDEVPIYFSTATPSVSNDLPILSKQLISEKLRIVRAPESSFGHFSSISQQRSHPMSKSKNGIRQKEALVMSDRGKMEQFAKNGSTDQQMQRNHFYNANLTKNNRTQIQLTNNQILNVDDFEIQGNQISFNQSSQQESLDITQIKMLRQNIVEQDNSVFNIDRLTPPSYMVYGLDYRFELARLEKIPSDGMMHKYLLNSTKYKGAFYYEIVSSVNNNAYLVNHMLNPALKPILEGPTNIFYGDDFIGEGNVRYTPQNAEMIFYLGVDPRVKVERKVTKFTETVGMLSQERKTALDFDISITNHTPKPIKIHATEYLPQSGVGATIRVSNIKFTPAIEQECLWKVEIEPSKTIKLNAKCDLFYPLNYLISTEGYGNGFEPAIDQLTQGGK